MQRSGHTHSAVGCHQKEIAYARPFAGRHGRPTVGIIIGLGTFRDLDCLQRMVWVTCNLASRYGIWT